MLDLTLARLAQQDREKDIARRHRIRAIREANATCPRDAFVPPPAGWATPPALRSLSTSGGSR